MIIILGLKLKRFFKQGSEHVKHKGKDWYVKDTLFIERHQERVKASHGVTDENYS